MQIEIFNVELGQCAMVHCPNGQKILIDAGHNVSQNWRPSEHFDGCQIERLVLSNADEDHASDFEDVMNNCHVRTIYRNWSLTSTRLAAIKPPAEMGPGIRKFYDWVQGVERPGNGTFLEPVDMGGVQLTHYYNEYGQFYDTNNLSMVTFVTYQGFKILFPGDLEIAGMEKLLQNPSFVAELQATDILVAPHHGRENACCEAMYANDWKPQATILSDARMQHATQETVDWWAHRTQGCTTMKADSRKVFTTRSDGDIFIRVGQANGQMRWGITSEGEQRLAQSRG